MPLVNTINTGAGIASNTDIRTESFSVLADANAANTLPVSNNPDANTSPSSNSEFYTIAQYQYPEDIGIYYMGFEFYEYSKQKVNEKGIKNITASIVLPIPTSITDALNQRYEELETGLLGTALGQGSATAAAAAVAAGTLETLLSNRAPNIALNNYVRQLVNLGKQEFGVAFNPALSIFYKSPSFKQHDLSWKFSPKNAAESETIRKIIRKFHFYMSPEPVQAIFFRYPHLVVPQFFVDGQNMKYLFNFKPCIIENCIINYAPSGTPSFFAGTRAPTEIEFKLTLKETSLWLKEDYQGDG